MMNAVLSMLRTPVRSLVLLFLVASATLASTARTARAQESEPREIDSELVKQGLAAYDALEYPQSIDLLHRALAETLTRDEKIVTYRTLAFCHVALGDIDAARGDFANLLGVDPSFVLDRTISPRVRAVFESARAEVATSQGGVEPDRPALPEVRPILSPPKPQEGGAVDLAVVYPGGVATQMELFYRTRGQLRFSRVAQAARGGRFVARVPGMQVEPPALEYYFDLLDDSGVPVAGAGSLGRPLAIEVKARPRAIYKRGWFWGVVGGVAAGAILAGVLAATLPDKVGPNTPATLTIRPH
jgi:hypothetical protein